jgi:hypothetical protein
MKFKRILILPEQSGHAPNACAYIRMIYPLATLLRKSEFSIVNFSNSSLGNDADLDSDLNGISAISTHRTAPLQSSKAWDLINHAKHKGIPIHWDLDDLPFDLKGKSHESDYISLLAKSALHMRTIADVVTVSTPVLHHELNRFFPLVGTYRNALADGLWDSSRSGSEKSFLYFGLEAHREGLVSISDKLFKRNFKQLKAMQFQIQAIGPLGGSYHPLIKVHQVPHTATTYPRFATWLSQWNRSGIGLIYHQASELNKGKSAIKALEYSALGLGTLTNVNQAITDDPIKDYVSCVSDDDFIDQLLDLYQDKISQEKISQRANSYVLKERLLSNDISSMTTFYTNFLNSLN